jgi:hypothetical protein
MLSGSKEEWDLSYSSAKSFLLHDAEKLSALEKIHKNPTHFVGWFLKTTECTIFLHGSVPADQNHSSVAAHLGSGASWSVVEQVSKLLDRQRHLTKKRGDKEGRAHVRSFNYKSNLQDQASLDDEMAKKQLSRYTYNKLWLVEYKTSCRLQFVTRDDVTIVWLNGKPILAMSMSSSTVSRGSLVFAGLHSFTSIVTNCALTENQILQNTAQVG